MIWNRYGRAIYFLQIPLLARWRGFYSMYRSIHYPPAKSIRLAWRLTRQFK